MSVLVNVPGWLTDELHDKDGLIILRPPSKSCSGHLIGNYHTQWPIRLPFSGRMEVITRK